jgi:hypothetical protein
MHRGKQHLHSITSSARGLPDRSRDPRAPIRQSPPRRPLDDPASAF